MEISSEKTETIEYSNGIISLETNLIKLIKFDKFNFTSCQEIMKTFLNLPGVYIFSGINKHKKRYIYVGQTNNGFIERIKVPNHPWNTDNDHDLAIWMTSIKPWSKNELDYIENYFINLFSISKNLESWNKKNGNKPNRSSINSEKQFLINQTLEFLKNKIIIIAGNEIFEDATEVEQIKNTNTTDDEKMLVDIYVKYKQNKSDAIFNKKTNSVMLKKGTILNKGILSADTWFNSPSTAGSKITGYPVNGWVFWIIKNSDETLQSIREK